MENLPQNQNQPEQYPVPQLEPTPPSQGLTLTGWGLGFFVVP